MGWDRTVRDNMEQCRERGRGDGRGERRTFKNRKEKMSESGNEGVENWALEILVE